MIKKLRRRYLDEYGVGDTVDYGALNEIADAISKYAKPKVSYYRKKLDTIDKEYEVAQDNINLRYDDAIKKSEENATELSNLASEYYREYYKSVMDGHGGTNECRNLYKVYSNYKDRSYKEKQIGKKLDIDRRKGLNSLKISYKKKRSLCKINLDEFERMAKGSCSDLLMYAYSVYSLVTGSKSNWIEYTPYRIFNTYRVTDDIEKVLYKLFPWYCGKEKADALYDEAKIKYSDEIDRAYQDIKIESIPTGICGVYGKCYDVDPDYSEIQDACFCRMIEELIFNEGCIGGCKF